MTTYIVVYNQWVSDDTFITKYSANVIPSIGDNLFIKGDKRGFVVTSVNHMTDNGLLTGVNLVVQQIKYV